MIVIIPARGRSQRIPRKNIQPFHGKPIIAYSIETALQVTPNVFVSTEDEEIKRVAEQYNASVIERPDVLAKDDVGTNEVMKHALDHLGVPDDLGVICLYATSPLLLHYDLAKAWNMKFLRPASSVISTYEHRIEDCGYFYITMAGVFKNRLRLITDITAIYPLKYAVDINTEDDWKEAERLYLVMQEEMSQGEVKQ